MKINEIISEATLPSRAALAKQAGLSGGSTYYGDKCTKDCSGHRAGREWAIRKGVATPNQMPYGGSNSFWEGGVTYSKEKSTAQNRAKKQRVNKP